MPLHITIVANQTTPISHNSSRLLRYLSQGGFPFKRDGVLIRNFEKNHLELQGSCIEGVVEISFTPNVKEIPMPKQNIICHHIFCLLNTPKGTAKAAAVKHSILNTPRDTKTKTGSKLHDERPCERIDRVSYCASIPKYNLPGVESSSRENSIALDRTKSPFYYAFEASRGFD